MAEVSPLAELMGQAIYHFTAVKPLLPTYGHLLLSSLFPIYIGAHASLSRPNSAAKPPKKSDGNTSDDDEETESQSYGQKMEGLEPSDALMFPLTAGLTLGGLYLVIKWMGAELLNKILGFYFSQMGIFFAMAFLKDCLVFFRSFLFPRKFRRGGKTWRPNPSERVFTLVQDPTRAQSVEVQHSPLPGIFGKVPLPRIALAALWTCRNILYWRAKLRVHVHRVLHIECPLGTLDILGGFLALPTVAYFAFVSKPWWLTNFLGFSFCYGTLQFISPSTFVTGSLILSSLFFYDIYFVFFTPLMVTVATKLDVPIKLLFPRPPSPGEAPDTISLAMLGLGDIIIPGMMVGLALRFDLYLYYKRKGIQKAEAEGKDLDSIKPIYQSATGRWGERFWAGSTKSTVMELEPPYHDAQSFPKTYFKASIVGYILGMIATLLVMQIFKHPQPALLYLVPGVLISLWGTALLRSELREMWEFTDAEEEDEPSEDEKKDEDASKSPEKKGGLFSRILFGYNDPASSTTTDKFLEKTSNKDHDADATKNEELRDEDASKSSLAGGEKKDDEKNLDIFTISLYVPRKKTSGTPVVGEQGANPETETEKWSFVPMTEQDNEPPAKRRRRSPRKKASVA